MNLRHLEMLLAVTEEGSYVKAGERLNVSHSAIHRQIRILEAEVGERVLVRSGRHVELTEPGSLLVTLAHRLHRDISNTMAQLRELGSLQCGRLRLGTGTTMLVFFLPQVLKHFRAEFPGVGVHVITGTADQVIEELENGNLELGIIFSPADIGQSRRSLDYDLLYEEEFVFAVSKGHPLARRRSITLTDITKFPFISYSKTSHMRRTIEGLFEQAGVVPSITMELENEEAIEKMIEINMGVALLSKRRAVSDRIHYFTIRDHAVLCEVRLVYPKSGYVPRVTREFSRICRSASREASV
jgi:DNA-binding transcriptional LysR family regulator